MDCSYYHSNSSIMNSDKAVHDRSTHVSIVHRCGYVKVNVLLNFQLTYTGKKILFFSQQLMTDAVLGSHYRALSTH